MLAKIFGNKKIGISFDSKVEKFKDEKIDYVAGIESRGFVFGCPVAYNLGIGFVPARKPNKLPREVIKQEYALEYGTNTLEMHADAIKPGQKVVVIDDLLATGGTIAAANQMIERLGGEVVGCAFLIELEDLKGRERLSNSSLMESYASVMSNAVEEYFNTYKTKPSAASSKSSDSTYVMHTVKKGESLGKIANKYHVSVANIKKWNNLRKDVISVGQKLVIYTSGSPMAQVGKSSGSSSGKSSSSGSSKPKTHVVKRGETLSSIAKKNHCTVNELKKWNGIKGNNIQAGQKLKIKKW